MRKNKTITIGIIFVMAWFLFLGFMQMPGNINKSFTIIKTVMPFPGKTAVVINKFIKCDPFNNVNSEKKTHNNDDNKNKIVYMILQLLSSFFVCNEKYLILLLMAMAVLPKQLILYKYNYKFIFRPPDIKFLRLWRLKFITPRDKCIQYLADKYDINPIKMYRWALYALKKNPRFAY